ncbi:MAG: hypothetical protein GXO57_06215 [Thermodesulfobacteria bacterium]|nr:hypothetical protein [Thermodesulfobacteriota bacterium]
MYKKKIIKNLILVLVFLLSIAFSCRAASGIYEYPQIYRDAGVAAQGGAAVATITGISSVFYNPAGLAFTPKSEGWDVNFPVINFGLSTKVLDFVNDFQDKVLSDSVTDKEKAVFDLLEEYMGDTFSGEGEFLFGIGKKFESVGLGLGVFVRGSLSGCVHEGFGSVGILDIKSYNFGGAFAGLGLSFFQNKVHLGADVKVLYGGVINHAFTASEIINHADNFDDYVKDNILTKGTAVTGDVGIIITPWKKSFLNPSFGISLTNIGDVKINSEKVIPQTLNVGAAINPKIFEGGTHFQNTRFEIDIRDITKNYEEDQDWGKRLYIGGATDLIKYSHFTLTLRGGFYQGYPSYGVEFHLFAFDFQFVSYATEVGKYAGQTENRRYMVSLAIRW